MKKKILSCLLIALCAAFSYAQDGYVILTSPEVAVEYQVVAISPNGRWACGNINDGNYRGFVWDLVSGEVTELSSAGDITIALDVSNDGTVVGSFTTNEGTPNNAPVETYGKWKDGRWEALSIVEPSTGNRISMDGYAGCISADGSTIGGIGGYSGSYVPVVWVNGELHIVENYTGAVYGISSDGKMLCGWSNHPQKYNRSCAIWTSSENGLYDVKTYTDLESLYSAGPFCVARRFSPNDKYVVAYNRVYNTETHEATVFNFNEFAGFEFYGVNNDGSVYGQYGETLATSHAVIKALDGTTTDVRQMLIEKGVNLDKYPTLITVAGISEDMKSIAVVAYDTLDIPRSLVIKLDVDTLHSAPVALKSRLLEGLNSVKLTWKGPLSNQGAVKGYNIYRDGTLVATTSQSDMQYYDRNLPEGTYSYTVRAIYADELSEEGEPLSVTVAGVEPTAPRNLVAVQSGLNDVRLMWEAPYRALPRYSYYNDTHQLGGMGGGTFSFETAIRLREQELSLYKEGGYTLSGVSFRPMSRQNGWKVALYHADDMTTPFYEESIPAEGLCYGEENRFTFTTPQEIPASGDVILSIKVDVTGFGGYNVIGIAVAKPDAGYSDLLRQEGQANFFSMYEAGMNAEEGAYEYNMSWSMGMLFDKAAAAHSPIRDYTISANGNTVTTVAATNYRHDALPDGNYLYQVVANYADGTASLAATTELDVVRNESVYKTVTPKVTTKGDAATLSWETPVNDDEQYVTYASDTNTGGLVGAEADQFSYMVGAKYSTEKLRHFQGYQITGFRFYPLNDADYAFILQKDGEEIVYRELMRGTDYVLNRWNTVMLDEPIDIDPFANYFLVLDCYDVTPNKAPIGMDDQIAYPGVSDLYSTDDGQTFLSLYSQGGKNANWMIGLVVADANPKALPIEGYNVYLSNVLQNDTPLNETHYTISGLEERPYQARVNPIYGDGIGEKRSNAVTFVIDFSTGIQKLTDAGVSLTRSADQITLQGGHVRTAALYNVDGRCVATAQGNSLSVRHLAPGTYILKANVDGHDYAVKLQK